MGGNNDGYLRISTSDDGGAEYIELGDYDHVDLGGTFTQWMKLNRTELYMARDVRLNAGLEDKDGEKGNSGQVLSSTGTQTNWIDAGSGPPGPPGNQGNQGNQGNPGNQGNQGPPGSDVTAITT